MSTHAITPHTVLGHARTAAINACEFVQPPGLRIGRHDYDQATILLVLSGEVSDGFGRRTETTVPGTLIFRPAGAIHTHSYGGAPAHCVAISLDKRHRGMAGRKAFEGVVSLRIGFDGLKLARELRQADAVQSLALESATAEFLQLIELGARRAPRYGVPSWLLRVREALHEHLHDKISLGDLVTIAGVHQGHLTRAFRTHFGLSVAEYLREHRVRAAARRLLVSHTSIVEIALAAGFYDQSHFTRVFRQSLGLTPGEWRRTHAR